MAQYGLPGAVFVNGEEIAFMSDWSLEQSVEIKEGSYFRGAGKTKTPGINDWSASSNGKVNFDADTHQKKLLDAFNAKNEVDVQLHLNGTTRFEGKGFIESLKIDNSAEGEYNIEISIAGNGGIKLTTSEESSD